MDAPFAGLPPDRYDIRLTTVTLDNPYLISDTDKLKRSTFQLRLRHRDLALAHGLRAEQVRNIDDCAGECRCFSAASAGGKPFRIRPMEPGVPVRVFLGQGRRRRAGRRVLRRFRRFPGIFHQLIPPPVQHANAQRLKRDQLRGSPAAALFGQATVRLARRLEPHRRPAAQLGGAARDQDRHWRE